MDRLNYTSKREKGKHLNYEERIKIETLSKIGMKSEKIAAEIGCSGRTIRRELAKGRTELLNSDLTTRTEYSADRGQKSHDYAATAKGVPSQQKWTQKSFKKRNESYSFFCFRKTAAFIPRFA